MDLLSALTVDRPVSRSEARPRRPQPTEIVTRGARALKVHPRDDVERAFLAPRGGTLVQIQPGGARYAWRQDGACEEIVRFEGGRAHPVRGASLRGMHADALRVAAGHAAGRRVRPSPEFAAWFSSRAKASPARLPARAAGFRPSHEGGGSTGWRKALPGGDELRVCAGGGDMDGAPGEAIWFAARLSPAGGLVELASPMRLPDALATAAQLPSPHHEDGRELVATYLTLASALDAAVEAPIGLGLR